MADYPIARSVDEGMDMWQTLPQDYGGVDLMGVNLWSPPASTGYTPLSIFKMSAMDALTSARDTWLVSGEPDHDGSEYTGPLTLPLRDIAIVDTWTS